MKDPKGLKMAQIQNKKVFINNTKNRVVHSPAFALSLGGTMTDEVAADPGQVICYLDQDNKNMAVGKGSWVVVGYEIEIVRWIDRYFYQPTKSPALIDVKGQNITFMNVPVSLEVLKSYPHDVKVDLVKILKKRDFTPGQRQIVDTMLIIALI